MEGRFLNTTSIPLLRGIRGVFTLCLLLLISCSTSETNGANYREGFSIGPDQIKTYSTDLSELSVIKNKHYQRVVLLANPFYTYFEALKSESKIVGVFNLLRMKSTANHIVSVGEGANFDLEKIIGLNPDLIICNSYQLDQIKSVQTQKLVYDEYLVSDPIKRVELLNLIAPLVGGDLVADEVIRDKNSLINKGYEGLGIKVLKLDNFGGNWFKPGCGTYINKVFELSGAELVCTNGGSKSEKVSNEEAIIMLSKWDILLFMDWAESKKGLNERLSKVIELENHPSKVLYCNTVKTSYFQESILNSGEIIADLHQVLKTSKPGKFFELIDLEE